MTLINLFQKILNLDNPYIPEYVLKIWEEAIDQAWYIQHNPNDYKAVIKGKEYDIQDLIRASEQRYTCRS